MSHLISLKKDAFNVFAQTGFDKNSVEWENYRILRNKVSNAKRDAKKAAMGSILHDNTLDEWQKIKIFRGQNSDQANKLSEMYFDDVKCTESATIANELNNYFSNIGEKLNTFAESAVAEAKTKNSPNVTAEVFEVFEFHKFKITEVSDAEVSEVLNSLKSRKNGGINQIPAFIYKLLEPLILYPLTHIINQSIKTCSFPDVWKKALVIPIHKGGDTTLPSNYRPISLLPILSKVFEKIISQKIRDYLDLNNLILPRQFGFRKGASTEHIILQLVDKIKHLRSREESRSVTLAALDIKKAFDCVHHKILTDKLKNLFNFDLSASNLIQNYLENRQQSMKINGHVSPTCMIKTGVPQGSVLGPLLFIIFINDLMKIEDSFLFADDCLLLTSGENPSQSCIKMENLMDSASEWYDQNLLVLNADKTDVMTICHQSTDTPKIRFKGIEFKQSSKIKYLGVLLDENLNFKPQVKKVKQKLYPIIKNFERNRKFLNPHLAKLWYTGLIRPHLEYCAPLTFSTNLTNREQYLRIENRCLKILCFDKSEQETRIHYRIPEVTLRFKYLYLLTFYKLLNRLVPIIDENILPEKLNSNTRLADCEGLRLAKKEFRFAINNYGAKIFNDLPSHIKLCSSLKLFKAAIKCHILHL